MELRSVDTSVLRIGYVESGEPDGFPVVLLHGFPYDVRAYWEVAARLTGARVIVPYLRGYGPTRFLHPGTMRSGQQAALGADLLELLDALHIDRAVLAGYDWGGRAACIVAALHPQRVSGLVTVDGYNIQDVAAGDRPRAPEVERRQWYQYYLHSERGRSGFATRTEEFVRLLWTTWSPTWAAAAEQFDLSRESLANPDFVDVVVHSYRHRYLLADGDPQYEAIEDALAQHPAISVPTIVLEPDADGVGGPPDGDIPRPEFTGVYQYRVVAGVGHNVPQEAPGEFAAAVQAFVDLPR